MLPVIHVLSTSFNASEPDFREWREDWAGMKKKDARNEN